MSDSKLVKALTDSAQRKLSRTKKNGGPGLTQNTFLSSVLDYPRTVISFLSLSLLEK